MEPNDTLASAVTLARGAPCSAAIGWARDEDVFCAAEGVASPLQWRVSTGARESGVLEVIAMHGDEEGAAVRVHGAGEGKLSEADAMSPWSSAPISAEAEGRRCIRVRAVADPWSRERGNSIVGGGTEPYVVEVNAGP